MFVNPFHFILQNRELEEENKRLKAQLELQAHSVQPLLSIEKSLQNAKMWFKCPECGKTLVITRMDNHLIEYCNQ